MAKVSPTSIKYMIHASFKAEGPVEKPDVIGAIFGQTEGLLGSDLEMRELQKEGRIGRIEVDLDTVDGKAVGEIRVPSALDKSETTIIAATLETIERIGPTESKIEITKIEDVRGNKRDYIIERAKKLLEGLDGGDDVKMSKHVTEETRAKKIQEYGDERLPSGDLTGPEVIVVEGRADVVNLLKNRVNNVIGMDGAKLPKTIAELGREKELTLFVDGDRGGQLIAKNVIANADIAYVAVAPDGKEVEELTGKEILMSLRKKIPVEDFLKKNLKTDSYESPSRSEPVAFQGDAKKTLKEKYASYRDSRDAGFFDSSLSEIKRMTSGSALSALKRREDVFAIIIDGHASSSLIRECDDKGVAYLAAKTFEYVQGVKVHLISL